MAPQPPDFNAYYTSDPRFLQQNPIYAAMESAIYAQYGWVPDGQGGYTQQSRADNPYSIANQLARSLSQNSAGIMNQANASGTLFSGAQAAGQNRATDAYNQALNEAALGMKDELLGVADQRAALIASLYPDFLEQAGGLGSTAPPPAASGLDPTSPLAEGSTATPEARTDRSQANASANTTLQRTSGVTALARLYNESKGKVDESVLRAIDQKLKAARARQKGGK